MKKIRNSLQSIGEGYPTTTGRLKKIVGSSDTPLVKVALLGDSTLDNGYWVQKGIGYAEKTHTVPYQAAVALARNANPDSYDVGNFAVDGATTADLTYCRLNKVLPCDSDHTRDYVYQLESVKNWCPDVAVLSVGGNNYREALHSTLRRKLSYPQLLFRITPDHAKPNINKAFQDVKNDLLYEYKKIIDNLTSTNLSLKRIVLLSQYYPSITEFTFYFIYTGFSHLARSEGKGQSPFTAIEETMNELYRELLQYAATKGQELVFVDVTSSLNPLGGNHTRQIEPNEKGSTIMGRLIAQAVEYNFPVRDNSQGKEVAILRMDPDEKQIRSQLIELKNLSTFGVKK